jgi:predicted ATPase/Tfp pilus assembly protein PilF
LEVATRLRKSRLVTLTGMGGIGKTRLAIEVAAEVVQDHATYADGVWLIALESLSDGKLVVQQIASVLGLKEASGQTLLQSVIEHLRAKRLLLVLDNCEHLLESSAEVADHLLRECVGVRILTTSREALGITGEAVWSVPSLTVPSPEHLPQGRATLLRVLMGFESVQLFVERAQAVQKTFALTNTNALAVAQVCARLEGIPLALELASARIKALSVEQIAARLDNELGLLTGGSRTAQSRQQTLRATLDWSYALLQEPERRLLRRLSVFVGGWRLEAAEAVCAGESIPSSQVLDLLMSLIDKSLVVVGVQQPEGDGRYHLLEMVRQYAEESLQASGEAEQVKLRHQEWCLVFAEQGEAALKTDEQEVWLTRLESEHENLRAGLTWSLETGVAGGEKAEEGQPSFRVPLRFCSALQRFWFTRGHVAEGRAWCERALQAAGAQERTAARAKMLNGTGMLVCMQSDYASSQAYFEESLAIFREIGYPLGIAASLTSLGNVARFQGDNVAARNYHEQSLAINQEIGDSGGIASSFNNLGSVAYDQGQFATAQAYYEKSQTVQQKLDDPDGIATKRMGLGLVAYTRGDYPSARAYLEASLVINQEIGNLRKIADSLLNLGLVVYAQGDYALAQEYQEESLAIFREIGDRSGIAFSFNTMGNVAYVHGDYALAQEYHEKSLAIYREVGDRQGISGTLNSLGKVRRNQGDYVAAWGHYKESIAISQENGNLHGILTSLEGFAALVAAGALVPSTPVGTASVCSKSGVSMWRAAHIGGAAQLLREQTGALLPPFERDEYNRQMAQVRAALGDDTFTAAWAEGGARTWEQAVEFALGDEA